LQGFDVVLLDAPRGREWVWHLITLATQALEPGGQFLLAGANRGGIKGFIEDTRKILGPCEVARIKAGNRLALGKRAPAASDPPSAVSPICEATVRGHTVRFVTQPGVFSRGELDAGTRALVETMAIRPGESMLDLGCGSGIAGAVAAQMGAQVVCVDSSAAALETCRTTLKLNSVSGTVLASDCASAVRDGRFDVVATNPPFHQGLGVEYDVAQQFIRDAAHVLTQGGRLYLVANRFIQYERVMSNLFSQVTTAYEDNRFHVLKAVR
jgi:16S rRNA (guanine1207-N2)-methyltransferase